MWRRWQIWLRSHVAVSDVVASKPATESENKSAIETTTSGTPADEIEAPIVEATSPSGETFRYDASFERGKIAGLQEAILAIMEKNGPITEHMRKDVMDNVYHDSLINWIKSFR